MTKKLIKILTIAGFILLGALHSTSVSAYTVNSNTLGYWPFNDGGYDVTGNNSFYWFPDTMDPAQGETEQPTFLPGQFDNAFSSCDPHIINNPSNPGQPYHCFFYQDPPLDLGVVSSTTSWSLSFWTQTSDVPTSTSAQYQLLSLQQVSVRYLWAGVGQPEVEFGFLGGSLCESGNVNLSNAWNNIVVQYNATSHTVTGWINGSYACTATGITSTDQQGFCLLAGDGSCNHTSPTNGKIDEMFLEQNIWSTSTIASLQTTSPTAENYVRFNTFTFPSGVSTPDFTQWPVDVNIVNGATTNTSGEGYNVTVHYGTSTSSMLLTDDNLSGFGYYPIYHLPTTESVFVTKRATSSPGTYYAYLTLESVTGSISHTHRDIATSSIITFTITSGTPVTFVGTPNHDSSPGATPLRTIFGQKFPFVYFYQIYDIFGTLETTGSETASATPLQLVVKIGNATTTVDVFSDDLLHRYMSSGTLALLKTIIGWTMWIALITYIFARVKSLWQNSEPGD